MYGYEMGYHDVIPYQDDIHVLNVIIHYEDDLFF